MVRLDMNRIFQEAVKLMETGQPFVMATVVATRGSTPQKPGARLLVRADGSGVGTLGGGCVEGDIWFAAKELLNHGSGPQYKDYLLNEDVAGRDGLVCGGSMYFFLEPVPESSSFLPMAREVLKAYAGETSLAIATVVRSASPGVIIGAKMLVRHDGSTVGTLGSDCLNGQAIEEAKRVMSFGRTRHITTDAGDYLYVEGFASPLTLVLMGGGHLSRAITTAAVQVGLRVFVMDDRPEFATAERFPEAELVAVTSYQKGLDQFPITVNTAVVVVTRGHRYDDMALEAAARSSAHYVGLIGSKRKVLLIYQRLLERGIALERIKEIHAPIGLDIGGRTPEEISVSIVSEILMSFYGMSGLPMKLEEKHVDRLYEKMRNEHGHGGRFRSSPVP